VIPVTDVQDQVGDPPVDDVSYRWVVRGLYAVLIGANVWIAFDWWRDTDQGRAMIERVKTFGANCEGCARRKEMLRRATDRMHREARRVVEDADVSRKTSPEDP